MKKNILFFAIVLTVFACQTFYPQITITKSDLLTQFAVGRTYTSFVDTTEASINIGTTGATTWDFSSLKSSFSSKSTIQSPASTPFYADFPAANVAISTKDSIAGVSLEAYMYYKLDANYEMLGMESRGEMMPGMTVLNKSFNIPAYTVYKLPLTFGTAWDQTYKDSTVSTIGGFGTTTKITTWVVSYKVDAYGTMKMPGGNTVEAIRVRISNRGTTIQDNVPTIYGGAVEYMFMSKSGNVVSIVTDTTAANSGTIKVVGASWIGGISTDVAETPGLPSEFSLKQNYPNPFNPSTVLEYTVPKETMVDLRVYDSIGREVAVLENNTVKAGAYKVSFNGAGLPSGIYFARIKAGNFLQTQKMILMK